MSAPGQYLISAILRTGDLKTALDKGITADVIPGFEPQWDYITDHYRDYGKVPEKARFRDLHREFVIKAVDDVAAYADEALHVYRRKEYARLAQSILQGVEHDDLGEAEQALTKAASNGLRPRGDTDDVIWANQVQMRNIGWVWWHRLVEEHLNLIVGDGGVGKGFVMTDLVARRTTGRGLPDDGRQLDPIKVLWVGTEDSIETVVKPRLSVAKADLNRVGFLKAGVDMSFPTGTQRLTAIVVKHQIQLVIIDGITSYLDTGLKSNNEQDVRRALLSLNPMAQETHSTVLASLHINKMSESAAGHRVLGSVAWRNVAKSVMFAGPVPDDDGQFAVAWNKTNFCKTPSALGYKISDARAVERMGRLRRFFDTAKLDWTGGIDVAPDDLMPRRQSRERGRPADQRGLAVVFLEGELADGPVPSDDLQKEAEANGINAMTLRRAKKELDVVAFKQGSRWYWRLP